MSKLRNYLCLFFLCVSCIIWGRTEPCPGEFGLNVEWLFMLRSHSEPYFAGILTTDSEIQRVHNEHTWHSGYRIEGLYGFCDCLTDFRLRWTHFPSFSDSRDILEGPKFESLDGAVIGLIFPGPLAVGTQAPIKETTDFYYLDALFGWRAIECCPFSLSLQGGIQYAHLRFKENARLLGIEDEEDGILFAELDTKSRFYGFGPEIGADFNYCFCDCFNLTARSYGSLLISKRNTTTNFFPNSARNPGKITSQDYWDLNPFVNLRFGIGYTYPFDASCWGCMTLDIEVGYEGSWLFNGIDRATYSGGLPTATNPRDGLALSLTGGNMTYALHGPYLHVGLTF